MHTQNIGAVHSQHGGKRDRGQQPMVDRAVVPGNFAEKRLARHSNNKWATVNVQARKIFQQREIVRERFSEPDSAEVPAGK